MYDNILVPIDGSEHAFKALDFAADLAEKYDSTLHLLHVAQAQEVPAGLREWARVEHVVEQAAWVLETGAADNMLMSARDRVKLRGVSKVNNLVEHGNVARTILGVAQSLDADVIVMGTRGFGDLAGLVLGSVAHKVTHAAPCTVVTVK